MNSEWAEPPKDQASSLATPGAQLAAQREAMGWSVEQIADQLKLAPRQVIALEKGDYAALPTMAVVRGFVRAYAKVVKLDATPLVAMIEVGTPASHEPPPRREMAATTFSESRFPTLTERSSKPAGWLIGVAVVVVVAAAGAYAYKAGLISPAMFSHADKDASAPASAATPPIETTLVKPGEETAPLQSASVPLISVPAPTDAATPATAAAAPAAAPAATPSVAAPLAAVTPLAGPGATPAAPAPAPAAAPPAAVTGTALVLKVNEDSWVEIRRPGKPSLVSRLIKAGSTETFDIKDPSLLIVGKPGSVEATLGGAPLALPPIAGGTISRVNIK